MKANFKVENNQAVPGGKPMTIRKFHSKIRPLRQTEVLEEWTATITSTLACFKKAIWIVPTDHLWTTQWCTESILSTGVSFLY